MSVAREEFDRLVERVEALEDTEARTSSRMLAVVLEGFERIERHLDRHDEQFAAVQRRLDRGEPR